MSLLEKPSSDFTDVEQIRQFAQGNLDLLDHYISYGYYRKSELPEVRKYRRFFEGLRNATEFGVAKADIVLNLDKELSRLIDEATERRSSTYSPELKGLYWKFLNQKDSLLEMINLMLFVLLNPQNDATGSDNRRIGTDERGSSPKRKCDDWIGAKVLKHWEAGAAKEPLNADVAEDALSSLRQAPEANEASGQYATREPRMQIPNADSKNDHQHEKNKPTRVERPSSGPLVCVPVHRSSSNPEETSGSGELRTLEDSLKFFGLLSRVQQLDERLEDVRRKRRTAREFEGLCKQLDNDLQKLSLTHHPDTVMRRGGSEEEVSRAKEEQTALNVTRTVLSTISKLFLEDLGLDHRYAFFTKMDIGLLGNSDEVERHAFDVLLKISLVSEIRQENVIGQIGRFLSHARLCVERYLKGDEVNFWTFRDLAFFDLERCAEGYRKLHAEIQEVETECRKESIRNIASTIKEMRRDCQHQLTHLEALVEMSKRPSGDVPQMYSTRHARCPVDDYFVLPFVRYVNVILACRATLRSTVEKHNKITDAVWNGIFNFFGSSSNSNDHVSLPPPEDDDTSLLFRLATSVTKRQCKRIGKKPFAHQQYKRSGREHFGREAYSEEEDTEKKFREALERVGGDLKRRFKPEDYVSCGTKKQIFKQLKVCREMMREFQETAREVAKGIREMRERNAYMCARLEEAERNTCRVSSQLGECRENNRLVKDQIQDKFKGRVFLRS